MSATFGDEIARMKRPKIEGYEVIRGLGRGAHGRVDLARDLTRDRQVAIKRWIDPDLSAEARERIAREGRALQKASHPNLVSFIDFSLDEERRPCLVMEHIEGIPLTEVLRSKTLPPRAAATLARALARGLAHMHSRGLIHRDIKPANVIVRKSDLAPVLVDFGIVKLSRESSSLTRTEDSIGTRPYMSPEQLGSEVEGAAQRKRCSVDHRSDVYALGALLFECVTGHPPWTTQSSWERKNRDFWADPVYREEVLAVRDSIPVKLRAIITRCLAGEVEARMPGALALAEALDAFLAPPPAAKPPARSSSGLRSRLLILALLLSVLAAVLYAQPGVGRRVAYFGRPKRSFAELIGALRSSGSEDAAAELFARVGPGDARVLERLEALLEATPRRTGLTLAATLLKARPAAPRAEEVLAEGLREPSVRDLVLELVVALGQRSGGLPLRIFDLQESGDVELRQLASSTLVRMRGDAVPTLVLVARYEDIGRRLRALELLEAVGPEARSAAAELFELSRSAPEPVRSRAKRLFLSLSGGAGAGEGRRYGKSFEEWRRVLKSSTGLEQLRSFAVLSEFGARSLPVLLEAARGADRDFALLEDAALMRLALREDGLPPSLLAYFAGRSGYGRSQLVEGLGAAAARSRPLRRGLISGLASEGAGVAEFACECLAAAGPAATEAAPALERLLEGGSARLKRSAERALNVVDRRRSPTFDGRDLRAWVGVLRRSGPEGREAEAALAALAALGAKDPALIGPVSKLLEDSRRAVRLSALELLLKLEVPEAVRAAAGALADREPEVRRRAFMGLSRFGGGPEDLVSSGRLLAALEDPDPWVCSSAALALVERGGHDDEVMERAREFFEGRSQGRVHGLRIIAALRGRARGLIPSLERRLLASRDAMDRSGAGMALSLVGPEGKRCLRSVAAASRRSSAARTCALVALSGSEDPEVLELGERFLLMEGVPPIMNQTGGMTLAAARRAGLSALARALRHERWSVREMALSSLVSINLLGEGRRVEFSELRPLFLRALRDAHPKVRERARAALERAAS